MKISIPYIGSVLTDNNYKYHKTTRTRIQVTHWMDQLAEKAQDFQVPTAQRYKISIYGKFRDERRPDLSNLHKVIGDALKKGLKVDDKHFLFQDLGYSIGYEKQELEITIEEIK